MLVISILIGSLKVDACNKAVFVVSSRLDLLCFINQFNKPHLSNNPKFCANAVWE